MTTITFTLNTATETRVIDGLADYFGYKNSSFPGTVGPPEIKIDFVKRRMIEFMIGSVAIVESRAAAESAGKLAQASVINDIQIV